MDDARRRLMWHGLFLFLLGLVTGLVTTQLANPRMGLSAHLEGVMNGLFLMALGAIWQEIRLSGRPRRAAFWLALYGGYANWGVTTFAAAFGTGSMTPIAAAGRSAHPLMEAVVSAGFGTVAVAMIGLVVLLLTGLRARPPA